MARLNTVLKASALASTKDEDIPLVVPELKGRSEAVKALGKLIDKAITGMRSAVQSMVAAEPLVHEAAVAAMEHCEAHGDLMPADRLIKGIVAIGHPTAKAMASELQVWFRLNSPIRWNAKLEPSLNKDETKGRIDYDVVKAEETSFDKTPQAVRARTASVRAHSANLKDATFDMMLNRTKGVLGWFNGMATGKDERHVDIKDKGKMEKFGKALNDLLKDFGGETAVVRLEKVVVKTPAKGKAKAA